MVWARAVSSGQRICIPRTAEIYFTMSLISIRNTASKHIKLRTAADLQINLLRSQPQSWEHGKQEATIKSTTEALEEYKEELKNYKTMAVVHGETVDEWIRTFLIFSARPDIDVLGIPKVMQEQFTSYGVPGRARILNKVISLTDKEIHLLGLWENLNELMHYNHHLTKIRSMDTSLPSLLEINRKTIFNSRSDCKIQKIDLVNGLITNEGMTEGARKYVDRITTIL